MLSAWRADVLATYKTSTILKQVSVKGIEPLSLGPRPSGLPLTYTEIVEDKEIESLVYRLWAECFILLS